MQRGDYRQRFLQFLPMVTVIVVVILLPFYLLVPEIGRFLILVGGIQGLWLAHWVAKRTQTDTVQLTYQDKTVFLAAFQNRLSKLKQVAPIESDSPDRHQYAISGSLRIQFPLSLQLDDGVATLTGPSGTLQYLEKALIEDGVTDRYYPSIAGPPPTR